MANPKRVGDGTTMGAYLHEQATGTLVHGRSHGKKLVETGRRLQRWLKTAEASGTLSADIFEAETLLHKVLTATGGK